MKTIMVLVVEANVIILWLHGIDCVSVAFAASLYWFICFC